jgi:5-methylcytosine-specific restriction enzyme subunit McrC
LTRLNRRYRSSLQLASLILRHASISAERGETDSVAFVFDLNKVFENFLAVALTAALRRHGGVVRLQDVGRHLDAERKLPLRPDVTWWRQGRCQAVVDAKYKRLTSDRFPNADAYQMLAYCVGYGLPEGTLVYARDEKETARDHSLRDGRTTIRVRSIDVEVEPEALLGQVQALAAELAASANR